MSFSVQQWLSHLGIDTLNAMQEEVMNAFSKHNEVIVHAPTGSGKTLAFLLPCAGMIDPNLKSTQALIIVPTRELALQIEEVFKKMKTGLKITALYGGHSRETEDNTLTEPPHILVGTPGRITDHIDRGNITTHTITALVADEYDKLLELGFEEQIAVIIALLPGVNKKILTSATTLATLPAFMNLRQPVTLSFAPATAELNSRISLYQVPAGSEGKEECLHKLLCAIGGSQSIVFVNHRATADSLFTHLSNKGIYPVVYHGGLEQHQREIAWAKFTNGSANTLITTDIAARGLHIDLIPYIIHYHLPQTEEIFIHRNGRTARNFATGNALLLLDPHEYLPPFLSAVPEVWQLNAPTYKAPPAPQYITLYVAAGKKDKINKTDIVGFFIQTGLVLQTDIGIITQKDHYTLVALLKNKRQTLLQNIKDKKIKNKKILVHVCR